MIFIWLSLLCFFLALFYILQVGVYKRKNTLTLETERKKNPNVAVLIPARDESLVIEELLISLKNQSYRVPSKNIYVIVERKEDHTVSIAKKYGMNVFVRKKLHLKTKGYALAELIEDLNKKKIFYDCYFLFDADNVLEPDFIENMLEDYKAGYSISTGYRALKNKDHYFPVSAGLTFFLVNELRNKNTLKYHGNLILSGTGYYIHGRLIKEWGTFPFHSLTEDYESSLYYTLHGISTHYREDAVFYDEQPTNYKQSITQRSRWIKGYFTNWFFYRKELKSQMKNKPKNLGSLMEMYIGILSILYFVLGIIFFLCGVIFKIFQTFSISSFLFFFFLIFLMYSFLVWASFVLLQILKEKTNISKKVMIQVCFYHPLFLISYVHAFLKSFKKNLGWEKITHGSVNGDEKM